MSALVDTPFKLTQDEILTSVAATLCLQRLAEAGVAEREIAELCTAPQYGYTASASASPCGPRFLRITDIKSGYVDWNSVPYCQCPDASAYQLNAGDILVARSGSVGKSFIVSDVPEVSVFASYMIRLRVSQGTLPAYIYWCLQSQQFWRQMMEAKRGSAMKNINGKMLAALRFPYPQKLLQAAVVKFLDDFRARLRGTKRDLPELPAPLTEQRRIVAHIEQLAAKIEEAKGLRGTALAQREQIIPAARSGIFERAHERFGGRPLGDLIKMASGEGLLSSSFDADLKYPVYGGGGFVGRYSSYLVDEPTVVIGRVGARCGCVFLTEPKAWITDNALYISEMSAKLDKLYLMQALISLDLRRQANQAAQPVVSQKKINPVKIPVPPLDEQRRIVAYLDSLQSKVDALKQLQEETAKELDALLPSILDKAFKGELVG